VGRCFREFGVVIGAAVLISAFVSDINTNAKCLFDERRRTKKSKFYNLTEPYFKKLNSNYAAALGDLWLKMVEFPILFLVLH
jgi:HAE1 family hydrophobic/amphiphilic exporter-1/multidrug efflux pump